MLPTLGEILRRAVSAARVIIVIAEAIISEL